MRLLHRLLSLLCLPAFIVLLGGFAPEALPRPQPWGVPDSAFADPAFRDIWARHDGPIVTGRAARSWVWGPGPGSEPLAEAYREGHQGRRLVQYFDKSRMEINDPQGDQASPWFVTQGLLVAEMIAGRVQIGHGQFERRAPARIPFGDANDPDGVTYAALQNVLDAPAGTPGTPLTATLDRDGNAGVGNALPDAGVTCAALIDEARHCVASIFWDYLLARGLVYHAGTPGADPYVEAPLFEPLFYVTGLPLTEAYWVRLRVGGRSHVVLVQAFERRIMTYNPANDPGWRAEMGNVGRHYYQWRYERPLPAPVARQPDAAAASGALVPRTLRVPGGSAATELTQERTLHLPEGFRIDLYATALGQARMLAWSPEGELVVADQAGRILIARDRDLDGRAEENAVFASGGVKPRGLAFYGGYLYVAEETHVARYRWNAGQPASEAPEVIVPGLPSGAGHATRAIAFGPDGKLYLAISASCDVCEETDPRRAAIMVYNPDGSNGRVFAGGLRDTVGLAWRPDTAELWATDIGRAGLGPNVPIDELNLIGAGANYGWPYCYGDRATDPALARGEKCAGSVPPALGFEARSAPFGLAFYDAGVFPSGFHGDLFVALHGTPDRDSPSGPRLARVRFENGQPTGYEDFITGWLGPDGGIWGRPVDPSVGPDGALYLSDGVLGVVYRITFTR